MSRPPTAEHPLFRVLEAFATNNSLPISDTRTVPNEESASWTATVSPESRASFNRSGFFLVVTGKYQLKVCR